MLVWHRCTIPIKEIYIDAWTQKSEVNLALMGLGLRKYIVNGAVAHRKRSLRSTIALLL